MHVHVNGAAVRTQWALLMTFEQRYPWNSWCLTAGGAFTIIQVDTGQDQKAYRNAILVYNGRTGAPTNFTFGWAGEGRGRFSEHRAGPKGTENRPYLIAVELERQWHSRLLGDTDLCLNQALTGYNKNVEGLDFITDFQTTGGVKLGWAPPPTRRIPGSMSARMTAGGLSDLECLAKEAILLRSAVTTIFQFRLSWHVMACHQLDEAYVWLRLSHSGPRILRAKGCKSIMH